MKGAAKGCTFESRLSSILNSGEVPNLFAEDEWSKITNGVRPVAKELGIPETKDNLKQLFVDMTRENLHIVLAMSPVGSAFRVRCRMFPSLINCCTVSRAARARERKIHSLPALCVEESTHAVVDAPSYSSKLLPRACKPTLLAIDSRHGAD